MIAEFYPSEFQMPSDSRFDFLGEERMGIDYTNLFSPVTAPTINALVDFLADFEVVSQPADMRRRITWCSVPIADDQDELMGAVVSAEKQSTLLYLLRLDNVEQEMRANPYAIGILVLKKGDRERSALEALDSQVVKRLLVLVHKERNISLMEVQSRIQLMLFRYGFWIERLMGIIDRRGTLQEMVDVSEAILGTFLDISDATYGLVAYTKNTAPPDAYSRELIQLGFHGPFVMEQAQEHGFLSDWREQKGIDVLGPTERVPFRFMTDIICLEGKYWGHIVLVCSSKPYTPGLEDMFALFTGMCKRLVEHAEKRDTKLFSPGSSVLLKLLRDPLCNRDYVSNQMSNVGVETRGCFCVACVNRSWGDYTDQPHYLISKLRVKFPSALVFDYEDRTVLLFTTEFCEGRATYDLAQEFESFNHRYGCRTFLSDQFESLFDLPLAYRQTKLVEKYRRCIRAFRNPFDGESEKSSFCFEEAFCICLEDESVRIDDDLLSFCLVNSKIDELIASTVDSDVSDLVLLYRFLACERKATPTATALNMHRNNVLYRIKSIERRFGFDLDRHHTRERLLACYRLRALQSAEFRSSLHCLQAAPREHR